MATVQNITTDCFKDFTTNLNGVALHYRIIGNGRTIFLVSPGWGIGSGYLQRSFLALSERYRLVIIDTRGSGSSGRPQDASTMGTTNMAADLEALRRHLGVATVSVLGHSHGGAIALSYAELFPQSVRKLILIDSQVLGFTASDETQRILQERRTDPRFAAAVQKISAFFTQQVDPGASDEALELFVGSILPLYLYKPESTLDLAQRILAGPISSYAFRAQFSSDASNGPDQAAALDRITAKTLILVGRNDFICPVPVSQRLHEGIRQSEIVIFEESGHFPWLEEAEKFWAVLASFLRRD